MDIFWKYLIIAVLFWILVDFTTAFNPDFQRWINHMPLIWAFYIGYPLVFAFLIYKKGFEGRKLFYSMLIGIFVVEIVLSNNALLYTFPIMLIMIPLALCIYSFITYTPKWVVEKRLKIERKKLVLLLLVWIIVSILNFATQIGSGT
jgi:hypothetical protein